MYDLDEIQQRYVKPSSVLAAVPDVKWLSLGRFHLISNVEKRNGESLRLFHKLKKSVGENP
jgi:hypothetical protein